MPITSVYVDGFNLFYGALRKTPHRWLDIDRLCRLLLPNNDIQTIKYFTALVSARPGDPDQPVRQQLYLRALSTLPTVSIHLGHFLSHKVTMLKVVPPGQAPEFVKVIKTEEKGRGIEPAQAAKPGIAAASGFHQKHPRGRAVGRAISRPTDRSARRV